MNMVFCLSRSVSLQPKTDFGVAVKHLGFRMSLGYESEWFDSVPNRV
jgi:hypothetical protein